MLSAAAMMAQEKKARASGAVVADGEKMTPAKAKVLIASFTEHITKATGMWMTIIYPEESTALLVAYVMSWAAQITFLMWILGMMMLVVKLPVHQLETAMLTIGLLIIGFVIYNISTPPTPGNLQIGMPAVLTGKLPTVFLSNLAPDDKRGYLESCTSISIGKDTEILHNMQDIPAITLTGVNRSFQITQAGDLNFWVKGHDGAYHHTVLSQVLLDPNSPASLVSVDQVSAAGGKCHFSPKRNDNFVSFNSPDGETRLVIEKVNGIHAFICDQPGELDEGLDDKTPERGSNRPEMV